MLKPGVKNAVIARTIAAVINLPIICQAVPLVLDLVFVFSFDMSKPP